MDDGRNVRFQKGVKSMKKMNLKNFFMKKKIAAGCIAAAALITAGSFAMVWQDSQVPELPNYTDPVVEQTIEDDDTPLASQPKVTTKTTKSSKTTKKNSQVKSSSYEDLYQETSDNQENYKQDNQEKSDYNHKDQQQPYSTDTSRKYTKKSKNVVQTQKVTTTVQTTTTVVAAASTTVNATTAGSTTAKKAEIHSQQCSIYCTSDGQQSIKCIYKDGIYRHC